MATRLDRVTAQPPPLVIAIDGPSGSGKSSVSRAVAQRLGVAYLDTGAMFRALTWWCVQQGVDLQDQPAVARAARELPLQMGTDPGCPSVRVGGVLVDDAIRSTAISESVSAVATNLGVRAELRSRQRALIAGSLESSGGVVAEGRDITTVVAPEARVRILLSASQEARLELANLDQNAGEMESALVHLALVAGRPAWRDVPPSSTAVPARLPSLPPGTRSCVVTGTTPPSRSSWRQPRGSPCWTPRTWTSDSPWRRCWRLSGPR